MSVNAMELQQRCDQAARIMYAGDRNLLLAGWTNTCQQLAESIKLLPMVNALRNTMRAQEAQLKLDLPPGDRQVLQAACDDTVTLMQRHTECHRLLLSQKRAIIELARDMGVDLPGA